MGALSGKKAGGFHADIAKSLYFALWGAGGGAVGSLVGEFLETERHSGFVLLVLEVAVWFGVIGGIIALALLLAQSCYLGRGVKFESRNVYGFGFGLLSGLAAGGAAQAIYGAYGADPPEFLRIICWGIAGGLLGFALSFRIPNLNSLRAFGGGSVGGLLGGCIFILCCHLFGVVAGRVAGIASIGAAIGMMLILAETLFRGVWLEVSHGLKEKRTVSLGAQSVRIGSDPGKCAIYARDAAPVACAYKIEQGCLLFQDGLSGPPKMIAPGDSRRIGNLTVTVRGSLGATGGGGGRRSEGKEGDGRPRTRKFLRPIYAAAIVCAAAAVLCAVLWPRITYYASLELGKRLCDRGRYEEAVAAFGKALERNPESAEAHNNLGVALYCLGKYDDSIASYRKAVELEPRYANAYNNLALALARLGRYGEAVGACRKAIDPKPGFGPAYVNLGDALDHLGKYEDSIAAYRKAIELGPDSAYAYNRLGLVLTEQGKYDEADAACRKAVELQPGYAEAHNNLGVALYYLGKYDEAVAACRKAVELQPDYAPAYDNLGLLLDSQGKYDGAIDASRRAIQLKPDFAEAYNHLGIALYCQGRNDEAIAAYRKALQLRPDFALAHGNLELALDRRGPKR